MECSWAAFTEVERSTYLEGHGFVRGTYKNGGIYLKLKWHRGTECSKSLEMLVQNSMNL